MIAALGPVLDHTHPGLAGLQVIPHILEYGLGHVRMADDVVSLANQFFPGETADFHKLFVAVGDHPFQVRGGNQPPAFPHFYFTLGYREILAHKRTF